MLWWYFVDRPCRSLWRALGSFYMHPKVLKSGSMQKLLKNIFPHDHSKGRVISNFTVDLGAAAHWVVLVTRRLTHQRGSHPNKGYAVM